MTKSVFPTALWILGAGLWAVVAIDNTLKENRAVSVDFVTKNNIANHYAAVTQSDPVQSPSQMTTHSGECTNINNASADELIALPGIGPVIAQRIIDYRSAHGPFTGMKDFDRVKGVGPALINKLKEKICF